jgi:Flp pilus assembly protein TadD
MYLARSRFLPIACTSVLTLGLSFSGAQLAQALSFDKLNQISQATTVQLVGERSGSGVIIGRYRDSYLVLTSKHVVGVQDRYKAITTDGQDHAIESKTIQAIADTDLALVQFKSKRNYGVARLASYTPQPQQYLFLSGFPAPNEAVAERIRLFTPGKVVSSASAIAVSADPMSQGYRLFYSNLAEAGMSGGGVFDSEGRVVGIHGRSDGEEVEDAIMGKQRRLRLGISAGIPIRVLTKLRPDLQLPADSQIARPPTPEEKQSFDRRIAQMVITPAGASSVVTWANYGNALYRQDRYPEALKALNQALEMDFRFAQVWYAQGTVLAAMNRHPEALNAFDRAIQLQPKFYRAWKSKSLSLMALKQTTQARQAVEEALNLEPRSAVAWYLRGLTQTEDHSLALEALDQSIALEPEFTDAWVLRGQVLQQLGRSEEAAASVGQALTIDPDSVAAKSLKQALEQRLTP